MIEVKFAYAVKNGGDGSAFIQIFKTEAEAEKYLADDDERFCDDVSTASFFIDEKGNILQPPNTKLVDGTIYNNYKLPKHKAPGFHFYTDKTDWSSRGRPGVPID